MGPIRTIDDLLDMMHRRAHLLLILTTFGAVFSLLLALSQKHMYQSSEVIEIAHPIAVSGPEFSVVTGSATRRLRRMERHLMTSGNLLGIINAFNLFAEYPGLKSDELVDRLRAAVRIEMVAAAPARDGGESTRSILSITANMPIAIQAQQVAHEVARLVIRQSGVYLKVIEPAALPETPVTGSRMWLALSGSTLSLGLALVLAWLLEVRNPVIRTAQQMTREIGYGPVISIPHLDASTRPVPLWRYILVWVEGLRSRDGPVV